MASDFTQQQSSEEQQRAVELSLQRTRPPADVPGYEARRFLGAGAYGEVWVAFDQNTGRQVAIKFYTHRGGVDWSLLSREVEKLVMLSADRHVVQLLDVGWDADPPHYVMEYIEQGSLEDFIRQHGALPPAEAVEIFRDVSTGLAHAHGKGILHCDLKPANVLLDQDHKPRLADFGQSRLSHDQTPALGTLFYMAPEQADLAAVPDARWDVYALGALLHTMLTGTPPHRNETSVSEIDSAADLPDRLARYRQLILHAPSPALYKKKLGVDRALSDVLDRCLAVDPKERFPSVQAVLDALAAREDLRARRPLVVLGFVGPCLLLLLMSLFAWRGYTEAIRESDAAVYDRTAESNTFAAKFAAEMASREIGTYFRAVEDVAADPVFQKNLLDLLAHPEIAPLRARLAATDLADEEFRELSPKFEGHSSRAALQRQVTALMNDPRYPIASSWFVTDEHGTHMADEFDRPPALSPVSRNFAFRSYFHGSTSERLPSWRPGPSDHVQQTHLSAAFLSKATNTWKVAISTPVVHEGKFLGIVALSVDLDRFMKFAGTDSQFATLVDTRGQTDRGLILQHPFLRKTARNTKYVVPLDNQLLEEVSWYEDPIGNDAEGSAYRRRWLAATAPVKLQEPAGSQPGQTREVDTGLLIVMQQDYEAATRPIHQLGWRLVRESLLALAVFVAVVAALWYFVVKVLTHPRGRPQRLTAVPSGPTPLQSLATLPFTNPREK